MRLHRKSVMPEYYASIGKTLTQKQLTFLNMYLKSGDKRYSIAYAGFPVKNALAAANRILVKPPAQEYLAKAREKAAQVVRWEFDAKIKKLKQIALVAMPDSAKDFKGKSPDIAIRAIAEANKMQGDYSPEKRVNMNIDTDIEEAKKLTRELIEKYRRDF
jgi:hypothetical protein